MDGIKSIKTHKRREENVQAVVAASVQKPLGKETREKSRIGRPCLPSRIRHSEGISRLGQDALELRFGGL